MLTLTTADARRQFANLIARVHTTKQRTILTRYGRPLVALDGRWRIFTRSAVSRRLATSGSHVGQSENVRTAAGGPTDATLGVARVGSVF